MDMIPVRREQFVAFGYDPTLKELRIDFKVSIYTYTEIPSHIYDAFFNAHSKTLFYNRHIKNYSCRKGY
ncbi:KTSC domain-containing protein [Enterococcus casseliflavus]|uniref:KTSC domain-containing protein n=1 Tax=Enterococcus casseliflavus TaxID=37734 RepID=UPI003A4E2207